MVLVPPYLMFILIRTIATHTLKKKKKKKEQIYWCLLPISWQTCLWLYKKQFLIVCFCSGHHLRKNKILIFFLIFFFFLPLWCHDEWDGRKKILTSEYRYSMIAHPEKVWYVSWFRRLRVPDSWSTLPMHRRRNDAKQQVHWLTRL